jgi:MoaA/NifB/PqqE/SkfB family radical SAM enzyme
MDEKLVIRLLDEGVVLGCKKVGLFMNGEPFVTKLLPDYIAYAKKIGYEYTYITTNGALATEDKIKAVVDAGIDSIKFSINGGSPETYRIVHQRDDYDKVMNNLRFTHKYREQCGRNFKILSSFVVTKYTKDELDMHYMNIRPYVDEIVYFQVGSMAGQMINEINDLKVDNVPAGYLYHDINIKAPCNTLWNSINVTCEGYLTLCCSEAFNYLVVEDVNNMSLEEAWHSERMNEMRKRHMENDLDGTECARCLGNKEAIIKPLNEELYLKSLQ